MSEKPAIDADLTLLEHLKNLPGALEELAQTLLDLLGHEDHSKAMQTTGQNYETAVQNAWQPWGQKDAEPPEPSPES